MNDGYGSGSFVNRNEVFQNRGKYLPQDTLTVQCRMWKGTGDISKTGRSSARTEIVVERISLVETVEGFSDLKPNQKKDIHPKSSKARHLLSMNVSLTDASCSEEKVVAEVIPTKKRGVRFLSCKLFVWTPAKGRIECGQGEACFYPNQAEVLQVPFSIPLARLMEQKHVYLPNDTLSLQCDAAFATGAKTNQMEENICGRQLIPSLAPIPRDENNCDARISSCRRGSALDDFRSLYLDQILTDVNLKTVTGSFPAHKTVLCARSPVFRAMFVSDMKEKTSNWIDVPDLEDETLRQFLLFLYTDSVEDLRWDTATKLYYAADKYGVQRLKETCSSFLVKNVSNSTAIELLVLADMHEDSSLREAVEDFILQNDMEIFGSDVWETFTETNPKLAVKTMCLKYKV